MPPQTNATVTRVRSATAAQAGRDDWDEAVAGVAAHTTPAEPAGAGVEKWAGSVRAYYRENIDRQAGGDTVNIVTRYTLYVDTVAFDAATIDTDDVIAFTTDEGAALEATARTVARSALAGIPASLQTTRLELAEPSPATP